MRFLSWCHCCYRLLIIDCQTNHPLNRPPPVVQLPLKLLRLPPVETIPPEDAKSLLKIAEHFLQTTPNPPTLALTVPVPFGLYPSYPLSRPTVIKKIVTLNLLTPLPILLVALGPVVCSPTLLRTLLSLLLNLPVCPSVLSLL